MTPAPSGGPPVPSPALPAGQAVPSPAPVPAGQAVPSPVPAPAAPPVLPAAPLPAGAVGELADRALRVAGGLVAFAGGFAAALLAVLLVPLRVGTLGPMSGVLGAEAGGGLAATRLPVAILLAVAGNLALLWFGREATGSRWGVLLPGLGWFTMIVTALRTTAEGDRLLVPDDWVATLTLFGGTLVLVIGTVLAITPTRPRGVARPAGAARSAGPARPPGLSPPAGPAGSRPAASGTGGEPLP